MQLNASERRYTNYPYLESRSTRAPFDAAGRPAKQQKVSCARIDPLSEAGVLQRILGYVGPGYWLLMSLVSKEWRESYLPVAEQQIVLVDVFLLDSFQRRSYEFTYKTYKTLFKAAVASAALMKLACDCELPVENKTLQRIAGRWGDIATLTAAFEWGMPQSPYLCAGAARSGCVAKLMWLVREQKCHDKCPIHKNISVPAAASGSVPMLKFLKRCKVCFTVKTACSAAAAGHQHVIDYLHAEGCVFDDSVHSAAAKNGHVHVVQRLRELECAWGCAQLCKLAATKGPLQALQWACCKLQRAARLQYVSICAPVLMP
jgi:hypothetical protein